MGFGEALRRNLGGLGVTGVAFVLHSFSLHDGHTRNPVESKEEVRAKAGASGIIDEPKARMTCSLVIEAEGARDDIRRGAGDVARFLARARLGGGTLVPGGVPGGPAVQACLDDAELLRALAALPPGHVLRDRSDLMEAQEGDRRDSLDRFLDALALSPAGSGDSQRMVRQQPGWVVPVGIGFKAISPAAHRRGQRTGAGVEGHVFGEDMLGLAEWITLRKAIRESLSGCFWSYRISTESGTYAVAAR